MATPLETTLSVEDQKFFETGEIQPGMQADPIPDPLAAAALGKPEPAIEEAPPVVAPVVEPVVEQHTVSDATRILQQNLAEAQQRVGALEQFIQQQKPVEPKVEVPDPATDPLGNMIHQLDAVNKRVLELQTQLAEQQNQQANTNTFQAFQNQVRALKDEFVKTNADFPDAYAHMRSTRESDLRAYGVSEQQIKETIFREEAILAEAAIRSGKNPAEALYEMSKRHGYVPKVGAAPAAPVPPQTPKAKLDNVAAAQAAAKNLPKTPVTEDVTMESLKGASDADLNKLVLDDKTWGRIVGRDQYPL